MSIPKHQIEILKDTTTVTGANLEGVVSGGNADSLHTHSIAGGFHTVTTGVLDTDVTNIGATETTLFINQATTMGSASVTVPSNIRLRFEGTGQITIDTAETLIILGDLEAGPTHIFDAVHATTSVVKFGDTDSGLGYRELRPEWWGAIGDKTADDTIPLQQMFNVPSKYLTQLTKIVFPPGKDYKITSTLRIGPSPASPGSLNTSTIIEGNRSNIWASPVDIGAAPAVELGYVEDYLLGSEKDAQILYTTWRELNIRAIGQGFGWPGSIGIQFNHCQFSSFYDSEWQGFETILSIHPDQIGGNQNSFTNMFLAGATTAISIGAGVSSSNWSFIGGKIQQCSKGVVADGTVGLILMNIDISLVTEESIFLTAVGNALLNNVYTESHGYAENNLAAVIKLDTCGGLTISNSFINGSGGIGNFDAAYGVFMENCEACTISNSTWTRHYIADVYLNEGCKNVIIDSSNRRDQSGFGSLDNRIKVSDQSDGRSVSQIRNVGLTSRHFAPWSGNQKNHMLFPYSFDSNWTLSNVTINGTTTAPDGIGTAQILEFPNTSAAGDTGNISSITYNGFVNLGEPLDDKTVVLQYWFKPESVLNISTNDARQANHIRSKMSRAGDAEINDISTDGVYSLDGYYDGYGEWVFVKHIFKPADVAGNTSSLKSLIFDLNDATNGISLALWGIQIFVFDSEEVTPLAPVWSLYDATPVVQQTDPGELDDQTGELPDLIIEIIPDPTDTPASADILRDDLVANTIPALRANIADLTAQVNMLRSALTTYGFFTTPDPILNMSGLTMYIKPESSVDSVIDMDSVSYLTSIIGPVQDLENTGTNRPTYLDGYINNLPTIYFNKVDEQNVAAIVSQLDDAITSVPSTFTVMAVMQIESAAGAISLSGDCVFSADTRFNLLFDNAGNIRVSVYTGVFEDVDTTYPGLRTPFLVEARLSGGTLGIRVNGGSEVTTGSVADINNPNKFLQIGGRGAGNAFFDGYLSALIVTNEYNPAEITTTRNYLNNKYKLY